MTWLPQWHEPTFSYIYSTIQIKNLLECNANSDYERMSRIALTALTSTAKNRKLEILSYKVLINYYLSKGDEREVMLLLNNFLTLEPSDQEALLLQASFQSPEQPEQDSPDDRHVLPPQYHTT